MKRIIPALLAVVLLGTAVQDARALGAYATWWNVDQNDDQGFGAGIRAPIKIVPMFSIDIRAAYLHFSDTDLDMFPLEAVGIVSLGPFYGGVGYGLYFFTISREPFYDGWHVLAGASVGLKPVRLFAEVKWTELSTNISDVNTANEFAGPYDLEFDGVGVNLGVLFGI